MSLVHFIAILFTLDKYCSFIFYLLFYSDMLRLGLIRLIPHLSAQDKTFFAMCEFCPRPIEFVNWIPWTITLWKYILSYLFNNGHLLGLFLLPWHTFKILLLVSRYPVLMAYIYFKFFLFCLWYAFWSEQGLAPAWPSTPRAGMDNCLAILHLWGPPGCRQGHIVKSSSQCQGPSSLSYWLSAMRHCEIIVLCQGSSS